MTDTNADAGIALRDSANLDAFARLRVSQPANLFDSKFGGTASVAGSLTWTEVR